MRAIRYQRKGYPPRILLTSLVDAKQYPAAELRALYQSAERLISDRAVLEVVFSEGGIVLLQALVIDDEALEDELAKICVAQTRNCVAWSLCTR